MSLTIESQTRKWGDSLAIIIPRDVVRQERLRINDTVRLTIHKTVDLSDLFGTWKTKKNPQELKDEAREGWD
ncbi:MAG TPA: AbrB/MazE/SpoVT family DNA-binding domain-containing protein [Candidatus Nanoarchaeia archaeon]|nr:AbrB/MazE/SpoVT family DNA-binding domain-containing protein [Candidatus Nanoarchaeia archaeon]